ncbi:histidine kinase [Herminiimonas fonticola]|uniref:Response regulator receiver domain-containing protein n=1 Tax=Herminiimonas fonticola TaxID=303380 RepID=A0A4R6G4P3_9BURK|nr:histidine kinase [Herminiimonas fonticola]RBA23087.1 Response regulator receiver domain [Herminiimonas fonticola]TDN89471.1 response regulator receiver domain-containing protein [Herminiimonas fonticola]
MASELQNILLVEKNHMVGSVIASTARQLNLATVRKVASISNAQQYLSNETFSGLIATIEDEIADLQFLYALRNSSFKGAPDMPVVVITPACDEEFAVKLKTLQVSRILIKPFKVRDVISAIELVTTPLNA